MPLFKAEARIPFPEVAVYVERIVESLAAHNMTLRATGEGYDVASSFGSARLVPAAGGLGLFVEAADAASFNRIKHDLTGLIDFVARDEKLSIVWTGDRAGAALPPDLRVLSVHAIRDLTPALRRITFKGTDLARYAAPDQLHCRLLFPQRGLPAPEWPHLDDDGRILWPADGKLASRIYTLRGVDAAAGQIVVDFVLHGGEGPGLRWAAAARPGDCVGILGPAAQGPRPAAWYLLAGDETGLPGIARILEDLPPLARGVALIEVADAGEEQALRKPPGMTLRWLHRRGAAAGTTSLLHDAIRALDIRALGRPADPAALFVWIGCEFTAYRAIRSYLRDEAGVPRASVVAFAHWRRGMSEEAIAEAGAAAITA